MHSYREAHKEGNKHYPPVGIGLVRLLLPLQHCPKDNGCKERGHCINLTLNCREPEGIGPAICKRANHTCAINGNCG